jgi:hypothetical protein
MQSGLHGIRCTRRPRKLYRGAETEEAIVTLQLPLLRALPISDPTDVYGFPSGLWVYSMARLMARSIKRIAPSPVPTSRDFSGRRILSKRADVH